jgi:hypothetical protein
MNFLKIQAIGKDTMTCSQKLAKKYGGKLFNMMHFERLKSLGHILHWDKKDI